MTPEHYRLIDEALVAALFDESYPEQAQKALDALREYQPAPVDTPGVLKLGNVDEPKVWMIESTGEPWLGDWIAAADVTTYANREEAEAKNRSLGAGGRYWVYGGTAEHNHEGELGYRISSKVSP